MVSLVIPCRNEAAYIGKCLDSVVQQNFNKEFLQVFVCDGMSDDGTREIVKTYADIYPFIHLLSNTLLTTPFALNLGLKASEFDFAIIMGAHAEMHPEYINRCAQILEEKPDVGCVGGIIENIYEGPVSEAIGIAMSSSFGVGNAHFRTGAKSGYVDTVAFGAYRKPVFDTVGYFDEELARNQDDEFNYRLLKNGFTIWLNPEIRSKYYVRASFPKLYRQYFQYGYWKVYVNKKHKAVTTLRQTVPALWMLFLLLGWLPGLLWCPLILGYTGIVLLYFSVSIAAAIKSAGVSGKWTKIVWAFWILHCSYGLGYLKGLWQFLILNKKPSQKQTALSR